jgi:DNA-binding Lrp family transcriptional regulator
MVCKNRSNSALHGSLGKRSKKIENEIIEDKIIEILRENKELEALLISEKLGLTYDTTSKHLKKMTQEGKIKRQAVPSYHYKLK